ncbi:hypothetical protein KUTeg_009331 [Tegillarca granosa]|uniref:B box-type domain-containing protein n=1 Tax=Tegillarca granosa TaxID=220873 RepID=A0ABQ9F3I5_TEGGR|nr:hypothetical protein KUTeg_009331 [Tegillarca granosa]
MASSKPISDFEVAIGKCDLCKEEEALYSCKDCQEELCEGCRAVHLRSKASSNHDVVSSSLSITDKTHRKRVKCHTHPKKTIRMYCKNCDEAVCVKCIADMKHENHSFEELESTDTEI